MVFSRKRRHVAIAGVIVVVAVVIALAMLLRRSSQECQYTERTVAHARDVRITLDSGLVIDADTVDVRGLRPGTAREGERCAYAFMVENRADEPVRFDLRYQVAVPGGPFEKSLRLELGAREAREIPQAERLRADGNCSAVASSFQARFVDATYRFGTRRDETVACRRCGDATCKNDGAICSASAQCGSQRCLLGRCQSS